MRVERVKAAPDRATQPERDAQRPVALPKLRLPNKSRMARAHPPRRRVPVMTQADFFPELTASSTSVVGLEVILPRPCRCGESVAVVGSSKGPHHASVVCSRCGVHRAWLSGTTAAFLDAILEHFGRPTEPITVTMNSRNERGCPATTKPRGNSQCTSINSSRAASCAAPTSTAAHARHHRGPQA